MFRFEHQKKIAARARSVANLMMLFIGSANSMSLAQFIEANRRRGFVDADIDLENRTYAFFEYEPAKADFGFSVDYASSDVPVVSAQGYGDFFGVYLSGRKLGEVSVEHRAQGALGRDARALQAALLELPGFAAVDQKLKGL
jgi:hypothetical protein